MIGPDLLQFHNHLKRLSEWIAGAEASLREMELSCSQGQLANVEHCQKLKVGQPKISCYMLWAALPVFWDVFAMGKAKMEMKSETLKNVRTVPHVLVCVVSLHLS